MSDILIKGMEMPKSCYACMFFAQTDYWNKEDETDILSRCKRTGEKTWESVNGYLPNCPLVPVPPHGDLIDYDFCMENYELLHDDDGNPVYAVRMRDINNAPTIIPATK